MSSPACSSRGTSMGSPFTSVPLPDPRSSTKTAPLPRWVNRAWRRDISSSSTRLTPSSRVSRPMVTMASRRMVAPDAGPPMTRSTVMGVSGGTRQGLAARAAHTQVRWGARYHRLRENTGKHGEKEGEMPGNQLAAIDHIVVLMLENRSFDHMLGFLYTDQGNVSPAGQPFEGLTGQESNLDASGTAVPVFKITASTPHAYLMPGGDPGEGYLATNAQLFGNTTAPSPPVPTNGGFVTDYAATLQWEAPNKSWNVVPGTQASDIMGMFTPEMLPVLSGLAKGFAVCD